MTNYPTEHQSRPTALLLVDCINAFYDPAGSMYYPEAAEVVGPIVALLERARASDALIIHSTERHLPGLDDFEWRKLPEHCLACDVERDIYPPFAPTGGRREIEVPKRRFSAFFGNDLALLLHEQAIQTLVICGVKTNVCIRATAQDAFGWGFSPVIVREATNSNRPHLAAASLEDIELYMGRVVRLAEAVELL